MSFFFFFGHFCLPRILECSIINMHSVELKHVVLWSEWPKEDTMICTFGHYEKQLPHCSYGKYDVETVLHRNASHAHLTVFAVVAVYKVKGTSSLSLHQGGVLISLTPRVIHSTF